MTKTLVGVCSFFLSCGLGFAQQIPAQEIHECVIDGPANVAVNTRRQLVEGKEEITTKTGGIVVIAQREKPGSSTITWRRCRLKEGEPAVIGGDGLPWIKACGNDFIPEGWVLPLPSWLETLLHTLVGPPGPQGIQGPIGPQGSTPKTLSEEDVRRIVEESIAATKANSILQNPERINPISTAFENSGCVVNKSGAVMLVDQMGNMVFELRSRGTDVDLRKYIGKRAKVVGEIVPSATPVIGASEVANVTSISMVAGADCAPVAARIGATISPADIGSAAGAAAGAAGASAGISGAVIGGVSVAAAAIGVGVWLYIHFHKGSSKSGDICGAGSLSPSSGTTTCINGSGPH